MVYMAKCFKCGGKAAGPCQWCGRLVCADCATNVERFRKFRLFSDDDVWYEYYCSGKCRHNKQRSDRGDEPDEDAEQDEDSDEDESDDEEDEDQDDEEDEDE